MITGVCSCACKGMFSVAMVKNDAFVQCFVSVYFVSSGSSCIFRRSWFDGDDLVSFCIWFFKDFGLFLGYARCWLCGVDLRFSGRGPAMFWEDVRGRNTCYRTVLFVLTIKCFCSPRIGQRGRLTHWCTYEVDGGSSSGCDVVSASDECCASHQYCAKKSPIWKGVFGLTSEVKSTPRFRWKLNAKQFCLCGRFKLVVPNWQLAKLFLPSTEALDSLKIIGEKILVSFNFGLYQLLLLLIVNFTLIFVQIRCGTAIFVVGFHLFLVLSCFVCDVVRVAAVRRLWCP